MLGIGEEKEEKMQFAMLEERRTDAR